MAIYHLSTKPVSRSSKRTATASAAYRAGVEIKDDRTGKVHDYSKRGGVVATQIFTPNKIKIDRSELWNMAETAETRKNSRTAREIVINIPHELDQKTRGRTVSEFARHLSDKYGVAVDVAIHKPDRHGDNRNHHAHLLLTTRKLERLESGNIALTSKSQLELSNTQLKDLELPKAQDELKALRKTWADITNKYLEREGIEARIDHRSHAERGLEQLPTEKLGWEASALERKGIKTATGDYNRMVKAFNDTINEVKLFDKHIKQAKDALQERTAQIQSDSTPIKNAEQTPIPKIYYDQKKQAEITKLTRDTILSKASELLKAERQKHIDAFKALRSEPLSVERTVAETEIKAKVEQLSDKNVDMTPFHQLAKDYVKKEHPDLTAEYATAMKAKKDTERLYIETPQQEAIRANIEATKRMLNEVYKDNPDKLKSVLQTIEDKTADLMSGKATLPSVEVKQEPQRVQIKQLSPNIDRDINH